MESNCVSYGEPQDIQVDALQHDTIIDSMAGDHSLGAPNENSGIDDEMGTRTVKRRDILIPYFLWLASIVNFICTMEDGESFDLGKAPGFVSLGMGVSTYKHFVHIVAAVASVCLAVPIFGSIFRPRWLTYRSFRRQCIIAIFESTVVVGIAQINMAILYFKCINSPSVIGGSNVMFATIVNCGVTLATIGPVVNMFISVFSFI